MIKRQLLHEATALHFLNFMLIKSQNLHLKCVHKNMLQSWVRTPRGSAIAPSANACENAI